MSVISLLISRHSDSHGAAPICSLGEDDPDGGSGSGSGHTMDTQRSRSSVVPLVCEIFGFFAAGLGQ